MAPGIDKFARLEALKPARGFPAQPAPLRPPDGEDRLARLLGAGITENRFGEHVAVRNWYSTPESVEPSPLALELLAFERDQSLSRRARTALADPSQWLSLDTETTGLAGGTGTYAFLVGLAWWDSGGLEVEQLLMRDFSEEHSVLFALAARMAERPVLVTFNGKTFDWPLLESRFTMTRSIGKPKLASHLDLLHPARALWKLRLGSVRLVDLERQVIDQARLGWTRDDDVPSALIPRFYFDYLRGGPPGPLAGVVRHNQMDLRGLAALFGEINDLLGKENPSRALEAQDLFGLSRFLCRRGERARAHIACAEALNAGLPRELRPKAQSELASHAKRSGDRRRAAEIWHSMVDDPAEGIDASVELAIYYERYAKDFDRALEFAELAAAKLRRGPLSGAQVEARRARQDAKLMKRIGRLRHRIGTGCGPDRQKPLLCGQSLV